MKACRTVEQCQWNCPKLSTNPPILTEGIISRIKEIAIMNLSQLLFYLIGIFCVPNHSLNLSFRKHNLAEIRSILSTSNKLKINHNCAAMSRNNTNVIPLHFKKQSSQIYLGSGQQCYKSTVNTVFSFDWKLNWAEVHFNRNFTRRFPQPGDSLITLINCFGLVWVLSPCRVVYADHDTSCDPNVLQSSQIAYATLDTHLIAGEERFRVWMDTNHDVYFEIFSFSKGAGILGKCAILAIRILQHWFLKDVCKSVSASLSLRSQSTAGL